MKKIHIVVIIVVLIILGAFFLGNSQEEENFIEVERGSIVQEIFETGTVKRGDEVSLGFKEAGRIKSVFIKEGDFVERGEIIVTQERENLEISLREAKAGLSSAQAALEKLLEGASKEEREVVRAAVRSAESGLHSAEENLEKQKKVTEEMKEDAYKGVSSLLGETYLDAKETKELVTDLAREHFGGFVVSETVSGRRSRDIIRRSAEEIEKYRELVRKNSEYEEMDVALEETKKNLQKIVAEMDNMLDIAESDFYENKFTDTQVASLREYRRLINSNLGSVTSTQRAISSVMAEVDSMLSSARAQVDSAEKSLDQAERELSSIEADPRDPDIRSQKAAIEQAEARVEILERRISDTQLKSPVSGTVSAVTAREGEIVAAGSPAVTLVPDEDFYIEVDIYEGDMPQISLGDPVLASFLAFDDKEFFGEIISINPVGRVVDGVVYYPVNIMLEDYPEETRIEMTVDVTIRTAERENVLFLPERNVQRREGKSFVTVLEDGELIEKEVETGIRGEGRIIEIVSGLEEGEKILID